MLSARPSRASTPFVAAAVGVGGLMATACGKAPATQPPAAVDAAGAASQGFLAPPSPTGAMWDGRGGVELAGRAPAGFLVQMLAPEGDRLQARADAQGRWRLQAPGGAAPRLFAVSATEDARVLRAEGAVAILPPAASTPALVLRSGAPALLVAPPATPTLRLVSLDMDPGGGFAVSGAAPPGAAVGLTIDGLAAGQGRADAQGRFAVLSIAGPVSDGDHLVAVRAGGGVDARIVGFTPSQPLASPYRVASLTEGWRVDWSPPAGGVQSLVAFAHRDSASAGAAR